MSTSSSFPPQVMEMLLDIALNVLSSDSEDTFVVKLPFPPHDQIRIANTMERGMRSGKIQRFMDGGYPDMDILAAFQMVARSCPVELGLIAWSDEDARHSFKYLAVTKGHRATVALPADIALPKLNERADKGIPTRVLVAHNHPRHPIRDLAEELLGCRVGPSGMDRKTMWSWMGSSWQGGFVVEPEFYLFESNEWRRFKWPSSGQIREWGERLLGDVG